MKKTVLALCLLSTLLVVFTSCNSHEHTFFTDEWAKDADHHWRACTVGEGCSEKGEISEHTFEVVVNLEGKVVNQCTVCGATNNKVSTAPEHDHKYAEEPSNNENFHWYMCTIADCYEISEKSEHIYGNPDVTYESNKITIKSICVDCNYESITEQIVNTEVNDAIAWDNMFKSFKLTNFTMDVVFPSQSKVSNHCIVTDKEAYYRLGSRNEFYTVTNNDETCTTYIRTSPSDPFMKSSDTSNKYLIGAQTETVVQISFENNFDKFTYDEATGTYICEDVIEATYYDFNGKISGTLFCCNSVVSITDGRISYISVYYYTEDESYKEDSLYFFKYYNIGISVVEIPKNVIDNAVIEK